jgi:hypothetical protein
MGKYEPLGQFLKKQKRARVPMTFGEIERVIGNKLPPSKKNRAFWSNNPDNNVMTKEWVAAGFTTETVDTKAESLVFKRSKAKSGKSNWQAAYGCMKGSIVSFDPAASPYSDEEWDVIEKAWLASWDEQMKR